ncbi:MAG: hypothetical protein JXR25_09930, partial [Pontiellaceae bacterium]|nr:hypothetical protein [Pontiellaceae bacterium]MBN2785136.1 hypothetical protein [Pontiellaceae bacterium]
PTNADSDGDSMPDGWEVGYTLDPLVTNALADADSDGGADLYEFAAGGNPTNGFDIGYVPIFAVEQNGATNYLDYIYGRRTNGVVLGLAYEVQLAIGAVSNGWVNSGYSVTGSTGLGDGFESVTNRIDDWGTTNLYLRVAVSTSNTVVYSTVTEVTPFGLWAGGYGLYGANAVSSADPDADGLDNSEEYALGTDPATLDSDGDGAGDGQEVDAGLDPLADNTGIDSDGDGLMDVDELITWGTDPLNSDSDGDTFNDGLEVSSGGNPLVSDLWRINYIRDHGDTYDLYSSNAVLDVGGALGVYAVSNGTATLILQMEQSSDLINWTNAGDAVIWSIPVNSSNIYFRLWSNHE